MFLNLINAGIGLFQLGKGIANFFSSRKKNNEYRERAERANEALNRRLREIDDERRDFERRNRENERKIADLQQMLQDNIEEEKRKQFEREKRLLEKEQE